MSDTSYGQYYGGDPRNFTPDDEVCTPDEIKAWKYYCEEWRQGRFAEPKGHETIRDPISGDIVMHIARNPFGLGVTVWPDRGDEGPDREDPDTPLVDCEDEVLLDRYLEGDEDAMSELADRHGMDEDQ